MEIPPNKDIEEDIPLLRKTMILYLARLITNDEVDPENIKSKKNLTDSIKNIGINKDNGFELHLIRPPRKIKSIGACIALEDYESAIILLYTLIGGELNTAIRIILRVKGFSHARITKAIQGSDFKTKIEIILELADIHVTDRVKQIAYESQKIRNNAVHFKSKPTVWAIDGNITGDHESIPKNAMEYFQRNSIKELDNELSQFVEYTVSQVEEIQIANDIINEYFA